ncbi:MAG: helix-turn-helix transcriptional regulator [Caldimonas sp.]
MPNVASVLKSEISRIAKKELRLELAGLKKAHASLRSDVALLKRLMRGLEKTLRLAAKSRRAKPETSTDEPSATNSRFSAKSLASQRRRLGLSVEECGLLIGSSGQAIYNWEAGKARPIAKNLAAIAALRTLGRKSAADIVAARRQDG